MNVMMVVMTTNVRLDGVNRAECRVVEATLCRVHERVERCGVGDGADRQRTNLRL